MKRRLTSWLLTLAMLLSLVPAMGVTASAAETGSGSGTADDPYVVTSYEELQKAMQKAGGGYVRLGKDIDTTKMNGDMGIGYTGQIVVNSNVALDLYSHKVTLMKRGDTERSGLIDVRRGSLTIEDSKGGGELNGKNMLTGKRLYLIECYDGAKVAVNSGKLSMWSAATAQTANAVIKNSGTVEINGGTLAISNQRKYDEVDFYLAQQDCALSMTSLDRSSVVINGGTFDGRVLLYAHAKSEGKAGSVINGGDFKKSVYVQKDRTKTGNVALDVSIRGGTYHYTPGYYTNDEGKQVSDPQWMFQFATKGFLNGDSTYYDETPYLHGTAPAEGKLDKYDLTAFKSLFPTNAILVAKGQSYTHRDYRTDNTATEVQLVDKLFTGADSETEWARLMNSEYQTIDVVSDIQLEDATLKVGDTTVPDNGGNVTTGDKTITITGKVNKRIAELVNSGKIDLGFVLNVVKTTKPKKYLDNTAATLSTASNSDGRLNVTVTLPSAQLAKADYSVRLDLFPKKPGTTTTPVGEGLLPSGWKLSADSANKLVTIQYDPNGGSGSMASQQVMSGKQSYTLPDCTFTAPAAGQVFKGWSTSQNSTDILTDGKLPLTDVESSVTVYAIWGVPTGMEIDKVTLSVKNYSQRQNTDDFRVVDRTPYSEMSVRGFWVREGLSNKDGDPAGTYDKTKNYSVVYEFTATLGYQFAENISVDDVSANDGEVWQVNRLKEGKILQVCVNYRSGDSIKGMWLKVKEPLAGDSAQDTAYEIRSTDGRYTVEYTNWYQGEFTNNGQISGTPFSGNFEAGEQYTCAFRVLPSSGYKVAHGYTDGLYLNGAQVTNCTELNPTGDDAKGYYGLYTFTVMDTSDKISKVGIQVKPAADRADIKSDFGPLSFTPASRMEFRTYQIYEGLSQTGGAIPDKYDPAKDYSAIYEFTTGESYSFAEGISTANVTINDGQVWKVERLKEGKTLQVFVNFPSSSNPNRVKEVSMTMNSKDDFKTIEDLKCQSFTPADKLELVNQMFFAGLKDTANDNEIEDLTTAYQPAADYTVCYVFKLKTDCSFAQDITKKVTISEGEIYNVDTLTDGTGAQLLRVFVSFEGTGSSSSSIKQVILNTPTRSEIDQAASSLGFMPTSYTPSDKMTYGLKVMVGLDQDETGPSLESGKFDAKQDYTVLYNLQPKDGFAFAEGFSAKDVTVTNGTVYKVEMSGKNCYVYVNFPAAGPTPVTETIEKIHLDFKLRSERTTIGDLNPSAQNPGTDKMELAETKIYGTGTTPMEESAAYDSSVKYTAYFRYSCKSGVNMAKDFTMNDVTLSDGRVQQIARGDKGVTIVVEFTPASTAVEEINELHLTFKPHSDRKAQKDLEPISIAPDNKAYFVQLISVKESLDNTGPVTSDYDSTKDYCALLHIRAKEGYSISKEIDEKAVTGINGQVTKAFCDSTDSRGMYVYVSFPAKAAEDPNYVTEVEVQVAAPVAGETPSITGITVTSSNADKIKEAYVLWKSGTTYVAGQEYSPTVYLAPKNGVTFAKNLKLKVNGKDAEFVFADPDGSVQFKTKITAVDPSAPTTYAVTVTSGGNGSATADPTTAVSGTEIKLTATPDTGYHFKEWKVVSGSVTVKDNKFKMPAGNVEIEAVFEKDTSVPTTYAVTVTSGGNGSATANPAKAVSGTEIKLTATPDTGYHFKEWKVVSGSVTITDNKFKMPAGNVEIEAVFEKDASAPSTGGGGGGGGGTSSYAITVNSAKNGGVTASHKSASKGTTVTLTVKPDKGYVLDTLTVLDGKDKELKLTEKNGKYTFTMPAGKVTVESKFKAEQTTGKNPFTDVPADSYYEDAVIWAVDKGITTGTSATTFSPDATCTRAQIVTFLWRAAGSPAPKAMSTFVDVSADAYYAKAVAWAVENGITGGTGDGKFSPDAACTRAQAVTFLWRANGSPAVSGNSAFLDVAADAYYAAAVKWAEKNGITGGIGNGLFGSDHNCTRAQIVTFLYSSMK